MELNAARGVCYSISVEMEATSAQDGNLGDRAQSGRLRGGVIAFGVAIVAAVVAIEAHAPHWVLWSLFVPFFAGAFGVFQGLLKTCPGLAIAVGALCTAALVFSAQ